MTFKWFVPGAIPWELNVFQLYTAVGDGRSVGGHNQFGRRRTAGEVVAGVGGGHSLAGHIDLGSGKTRVDRLGCLGGFGGGEIAVNTLGRGTTVVDSLAEVGSGTGQSVGGHEILGSRRAVRRTVVELFVAVGNGECAVAGEI